MRNQLSIPPGVSVLQWSPILLATGSVFSLAYTYMLAAAFLRRPSGSSKRNIWRSGVTLAKVCSGQPLPRSGLWHCRSHAHSPSHHLPGHPGGLSAQCLRRLMNSQGRGSPSTMPHAADRSRGRQPVAEPTRLCLDPGMDQCPWTARAAALHTQVVWGSPGHSLGREEDHLSPGSIPILFSRYRKSSQSRMF